MRQKGKPKINQQLITIEIKVMIVRNQSNHPHSETFNSRILTSPESILTVDNETKYVVYTLLHLFCCN